MRSVAIIPVVVIVAISASCLAICGCATDTHEMATAKKAYSICVGVGDGFAGKCKGSKSDASKMKSLLSKHSKKVILLQDKKATRAAVLAALEEGVKYELMIFYFSGHGGYMPSTSDKTEVDGRDEFICCYDNLLVDNDIWAVLQKSKGRVVLMFDSCHSGTMYRNGMITMRGARRRSVVAARASSTVSGPVNMICWSGCPDDKYSYGTSSGGLMTTSLRKNYKKTLTYYQLWKKMEADKSVKKYETIQQTKMGKNFEHEKVFQ